MGVPTGDPQELFVPDEAKPAGAAVDADGRVTCVLCGAKVALVETEVVGLGYRCAACTQKSLVSDARGVPPLSASLTPSEIARLRTMAKRLMLSGAGGMVLGVVVAFISFKAGYYTFFFGMMWLGYGLFRWRRAR
jgi:hypothetical protein